VKVVVLLSGGLDSVTAFHEALREHEVEAGLSFDYGAKHHSKELPMAAWQCRKAGVVHHVIPLDFVANEFRSDLLKTGGDIPDGHYEERSMRSTVVPFRNGIMLSIAAGFAESCGAKAVVIAAHAGDHAVYPDCREDFLQPMSEAVRAGTYAQIDLLRPFVGMDKAAIVRRGTELGVDFFYTWSCYKGGEIHCGSCGTCVERREAFIMAQVQDPTAYAVGGPLPPSPTESIP